ncbi:hypothetical protein AGMMS50212_06370 [Spirochaetia bacterium]|nr:hypothetical protein AGMMS50212_06370 [Spirochaetia bacterium]
MNCKRRPFFYFIVPVIVQVLTGCNAPKETEFSFTDAERNVIPVMAYSTEAAAGLLDLRRSKEYTYSLQQLLPVNSNTSLEIDYTLDYTGSADVLDLCKIIVKLDDKSSWELPLDYSFLGLKVNSNRNKYLIPINSQSIQNVIFSIVYKNNNGKKNKKNKLAVQINSLKLSKRAYGFEKTEDCILTTPFVFLDKSTAEIKNSYINPLSKYKIEGRADIVLSGYNKNSTIGINGANDIKYRFYTNDDSKFVNNITIPYIFSSDDDYPVILSGDADTFLLCGADNAKDLNADPRVILNYPKELWRNKDYEYFAWDIFPSVLIFDTINYDVQDRLFKRLAFFSEKKGFRGRLARDEEIASLHGWNAHDYNSKSLVNFFNAVNKINSVETFMYHKHTA